MQNKLSRRKIAEYVASHVENGKIPARYIDEVAAYLLESHRLRELPLVVRTIEEVLAERGEVVADVVVARPLEAELRTALSNMIGGDRVYLREVVDPSLLGGMRVDKPGESLDTSLIKKINTLRSARIA